MDELAEYLNMNQANSGAGGGTQPSPPSDFLLSHLPSPEDATRAFGRRLLNVPDERIRALFCIRMFALKQGIANAIAMVEYYPELEHETFPSRYHHVRNLEGVPQRMAYDLEIAYLQWEFATNKMDHLHNYAVRINSARERFLWEHSPETVAYFKNTLIHMIHTGGYSRITLGQLADYCRIPLLRDIIHNELLPNVLASALET